MKFKLYKWFKATLLLSSCYNHTGIRWSSQTAWPSRNNNVFPLPPTERLYLTWLRIARCVSCTRQSLLTIRNHLGTPTVFMKTAWLIFLVVCVVYYVLFFFFLYRWVPLVKQELLILPEHLNLPLVFSGVRVIRSLVLCVMVCRSLFVPLSFFFWPLCCLSFFDLRFIPLVSSNSSDARLFSGLSILDPPPFGYLLILTLISYYVICICTRFCLTKCYPLTLFVVISVRLR